MTISRWTSKNLKWFMKVNTGLVRKRVSNVGVSNVGDTMEPPYQKTNANTKTQISYAVTGEPNGAFDFATRIVQSLFFVDPKFQASNLLLWL